MLQGTRHVDGWLAGVASQQIPTISNINPADIQIYMLGSASPASRPHCLGQRHAGQVNVPRKEEGECKYLEPETRCSLQNTKPKKQYLIKENGDIFKRTY